jgi:hypothetical protein
VEGERMKKLVAFVIVIAGLMVLSVPGTVRADTINGTGAYQNWTTAVLNQDNVPYWDGASSDGNGQGIGYYLTNTGAFGGGSGPGSIPYWGNNDGSADTSFYFDKTDPGQMAALKIEIAGNAPINQFGWYDKVTGTQTTLFTGPQGAGALATFTPTSTYGFFLQVGNGPVYYTESGKNTQDTTFQHFAVFKEAPSVYWVGVEDLGPNNDRDYNDMVVKVSAVPIPGAVWLLGSGLLGLLGLRRRSVG